MKDSTIARQVAVKATLALAPTMWLYMVWVSCTRPLTTATRIARLSLLEWITIYSKDNTHYNPQRGMWLILGHRVGETKIGSTRQYYKLASCWSLSSEAIREEVITCNIQLTLVQ